MVEAIVLLAQSLRISGTLEVRISPYSHWITLELSFPRAIPLDPHFQQRDEALIEFPTLRLQPDIFWRRLVLEWVDKATWIVRGRLITVSLTQYARRPSCPGELYFLGLTPKPTPGLEVHLDPDGLALALASGVRSAFRLGEETQFVLQAADGKTSVREIYRQYVKRFSLVHPEVLGKMIEELIAKGLLVPGEALAEDRGGGGFLAFFVGLARWQISLPHPDVFFSFLARWLGWLWSGVSLAVVLILVGWTLARLGMEVSLGVIFSGLSGAAGMPFGAWLFIVIVFYCSILLHELSHGMTCKRFGRKVRAFGLLLYYGLLCAYVDTTETWMVKERWKRALVSLAGPLATLTLACLFHWGEYFSLMAGWEITARAFDLLALISFTSALLNLLPVLELDGYYALADLLDQPNLRQRSFAYVEALLGALGGRGKAPTLPWGERLLFLGYAIASLAILLLLIGLPLYNAMRLALGGQFTLGALVSFLFALMLFVQALAQAGMGWYRKRYLTPLDLKAIA